jgi:AIPR protein
VNQDRFAKRLWRGWWRHQYGPTTLEERVFESSQTPAVVAGAVHHSQIVDARKFAYQANITAYTVAALSRRTDGKIDFERMWAQQAVSPELSLMLSFWVTEVDRALRDSSGNRMPSEWAKKVECRDAVLAIPLELPTPPPPELARQTTSHGPPAPPAAPAPGRRSWFRK